MLVLYPEIKPYQRHQFKVSELHDIYVDEAGNPDGVPLIFVHGGPGGACDFSSRRFYDPQAYRIITFDQRGCGRSTPHAELTDNTTEHLIADMETIRQQLGIEQWILFGGSWGATLSLLYAQAHPDRTLGLILRGVFLCRATDLEWLYRNGANRVFPDHWAEFANYIPEAERGDLLKAYYERLTGMDELARMAAAKSWVSWESHCSRLRPSPDALSKSIRQRNALAMSRIETHYFVNRGFIRENQILDNMSSIKHIPAKIIHGRYDMVCPLDNSVSLHEAWPASELYIIRDAGHSSAEPGIVDALIRATQDMVKLLENREPA